jgi:hypothetical protein
LGLVVLSRARIFSLTWLVWTKIESAETGPDKVERANLPTAHESSSELAALARESEYAMSRFPVPETQAKPRN